MGGRGAGRREEARRRLDCLSMVLRSCRRPADEFFSRFESAADIDAHDVHDRDNLAAFMLAEIECARIWKWTAAGKTGALTAQDVLKYVQGHAEVQLHAKSALGAHFVERLQRAKAGPLAPKNFRRQANQRISTRRQHEVLAVKQVTRFASVARARRQRHGQAVRHVKTAHRRASVFGQDAIGLPDTFPEEIQRLLGVAAGNDTDNLIPAAKVTKVMREHSSELLHQFAFLDETVLDPEFFRRYAHTVALLDHRRKIHREKFLKFLVREAEIKRLFDFLCGPGVDTVALRRVQHTLEVDNPRLMTDVRVLIGPDFAKRLELCAKACSEGGYGKGGSSTAESQLTSKAWRVAMNSPSGYDVETEMRRFHRAHLRFVAARDIQRIARGFTARRRYQKALRDEAERKRKAEEARQKALRDEAERKRKAEEARIAKEKARQAAKAARKLHRKVLRAVTVAKAAARAARKARNTADAVADAAAERRLRAELEAIKKAVAAANAAAQAARAARNTADAAAKAAAERRRLAELEAAENARRDARRAAREATATADQAQSLALSCIELAQQRADAIAREEAEEAAHAAAMEKLRVAQERAKKRQAEYLKRRRVYGKSASKRGHELIGTPAKFVRGLLGLLPAADTGVEDFLSKQGVKNVISMQSDRLGEQFDWWTKDIASNSFFRRYGQDAKVERHPVVREGHFMDFLERECRLHRLYNLIQRELSKRMLTRKVVGDFVKDHAKLATDARVLISPEFSEIINRFTRETNMGDEKCSMRNFCAFMNPRPER